MEKFKGKWCINITKENVDYLKENFKCGAGYYPGQTLFFNEDGFRETNSNTCWNVDGKNRCLGIQYDEISFIEFQNMVNGVIGEPQYEIY